MLSLGTIRAALLAAALATTALIGGPAYAESQSYMRLSPSEALQNRQITLGLNKSIVIDLPEAAGDVLVSNPAIADAVLRTSTRLYLIGVQLGQANIFLFNGAGGQMASFDVYVEADLGSLNQLLAEAIPDGYVRAEAMNGSIILRGQVSSASDSSRAEEITRGMLGQFTVAGATATTGAPATTTTTTSGTGGIVNLLTITGEEQVALKVTIAEVQREVTKQLGINIKGNGFGSDYGVGTNLTGPLGAVTSGAGLSPLVNPDGGEIGFGFSGADFNIQATLRALDETNMIRTLAEPTLTAVSGETANFLAGGEIGYRIVQSSDTGGTIFTTEFKPFGVQLAFTPVVLSAGRISIKVRTSVSEISGFTDGIPSFTTRSAETTVEQPSGGAFVIGGLIQQNSQRAVTGFPGLQKLPILGSLFTSKSFLDRETELVMIVTPYLVKPTSPRELARPDDNLALSGDAEAYFLNRLTKVYGKASPAPAGSAAGQVGFTFD